MKISISVDDYTKLGKSNILRDFPSTLLMYLTQRKNSFDTAIMVNIFKVN